MKRMINCLPEAIISMKTIDMIKIIYFVEITSTLKI